MLYLDDQGCPRLLDAHVKIGPKVVTFIMGNGAIYNFAYKSILTK